MLKLKIVLFYKKLKISSIFDINIAKKDISILLKGNYKATN